MDQPQTWRISFSKNVTVAFMPWQGHNFEDSILISERCYDDVYFSSYRRVWIPARDTNLEQRK